MNDTKQIEWTSLDDGPKDIPDLTRRRKDGGFCTGYRDGYYCTRSPGHTGRHAAGTSRTVVAVWS